MKEDPAPQTGSELAAELDVDASPLLQSRFTGVQIFEAVGCHVERQRDRSSGTDRDRQWRFGGGGGELWKAVSAKEKSGLWTGFPERSTGHSESAPLEPSGRVGLNNGYVVELVSGKIKHIRRRSPRARQGAASRTCLVPVCRCSMIRWDWNPLQAATETKTRQRKVRHIQQESRFARAVRLTAFTFKALS